MAEFENYRKRTEKEKSAMYEIGAKDIIEKIEGLETQYEDIGLLIEMAYEENDESLIPEIEEEIQRFETVFEELRIQTLLSGSLRMV